MQRLEPLRLKSLSVFLPGLKTRGFQRLRVTYDSALTVEKVNIVAPPPGTIQGIVYNDLNGNRLQDAGETGIQGRTVFLDANQNGILDIGETLTTTSLTGSYRFENVDSGTHSIAQVQPEGWKNTGPKVVVEPDKYKDGTVLNNKVPGVTFEGNISVMTTSGASTGSKVFVWEPKSPFFQGSSRQLKANFDSPVNTVSIDFTNGTSSKVNIGQLKAYDQAGNLLATDTTRELGRFQTETLTISLDDPSIARIVASTPNNSNYGKLDNLTFSGGAQIVNVAPRETVSNVDFGSQTFLGTIQGIVYNDLNGNRLQDAGETGIQGRTVFLDANQNGILDTGETLTTTSSTGSYRFENVDSGTYLLSAEGSHHNLRFGVR